MDNRDDLKKGFWDSYFGTAKFGEVILREDDSSDASVSDEAIHSNAQPESLEKGGVSWSTKKLLVFVNR
jgi:hypothetical protein